MADARAYVAMPAGPAGDGLACKAPGPPKVPNRSQSAPLLLSDLGRAVLVECSGRTDNAEERRNHENIGWRQSAVNGRRKPAGTSTSRLTPAVRPSIPFHYNPRCR